MGDHADDMEAMAQLYDAKISEMQIKINRNARKGYWQTKDGTKIKFDDMTNSHKINIMRIFENSYITLPPQITEVLNG